ncbi:MAG: cation transporter [Chloroflexi bacterium]|nr:MAG: cation transporter [Chloroflexota bacterium]
MRPMYLLLVFVPASLAAELLHQETAVFITSALAIVPLAALLGEATEQLAIRLGPQRGGLLNATLGNLTELIVGFFLVAAGDVAILKATLIGSIVGNLLLVLGLSFAVGGLYHKSMTFNPRTASVHASSLLLAVAGLVVPAMLVFGSSVGSTAREAVSVFVAIVLMSLYLAVNSLHSAISVLHIPTAFVGLILIPVIGNAAEHASAIFFAIKNKLDITVEIAVGSSTQVAMFVAPLLVFVSLFTFHPIDFVFTGFEIGIVALATLIVTVTSRDGETNWLEGAQLLGAYMIIAVTAFFLAA